MSTEKLPEWPEKLSRAPLVSEDRRERLLLELAPFTDSSDSAEVRSDERENTQPDQ